MVTAPCPAGELIEMSPPCWPGTLASSDTSKPLPIAWTVQVTVAEPPGVLPPFVTVVGLPEDGVPSVTNAVGEPPRGHAAGFCVPGPTVAWTNASGGGGGRLPPSAQLLEPLEFTRDSISLVVPP